MSTSEDGHEFGLTSYGELTASMIEGFDNLEDISDLSNQEKLELIKYKTS